MFLKFDMNLKDANSLYKFFGCFRDSPDDLKGRPISAGKSNTTIK